MPRAGHIPGAANLPFTSLINEADGKFKSTTALRELFERAGVETNNTVVSYCHIGQQASLLYFVARLLGYDRISTTAHSKSGARGKTYPSKASRR